LVQEQVKDQPK